VPTPFDRVGAEGRYSAEPADELTAVPMVTTPTPQSATGLTARMRDETVTATARISGDDGADRSHLLTAGRTGCPIRRDAGGVQRCLERAAHGNTHRRASPADF
jgi:hypothetical protein